MLRYLYIILPTIVFVTQVFWLHSRDRTDRTCSISKSDKTGHDFTTYDGYHFFREYCDFFCFQITADKYSFLDTSRHLAKSPRIDGNKNLLTK